MNYYYGLSIDPVFKGVYRGKRAHPSEATEKERGGGIGGGREKSLNFVSVTYYR